MLISLCSPPQLSPCPLRPIDRSNQCDSRNLHRTDTPTLVALVDVTCAPNATRRSYFGVADRSTQDARGSSIFTRRVTSQPRSLGYACLLLSSVPVDACSARPPSAGLGRPAVELPPVVDISLPAGTLSLGRRPVSIWRPRDSRGQHGADLRGQHRGTEPGVLVETRWLPADRGREGQYGPPRWLPDRPTR